MACSEKLSLVGGAGGVSKEGSLDHLGAFGVTSNVAIGRGVVGCEMHGCMYLPRLASRSASLLPSMVTWEGTFSQCIVLFDSSNSTSSCSYSATFESGPKDPIHPWSFHHRAAPAAPSMTYCESVQIAMSPVGKMCSALRTTSSSAELFI